MTLPRFGALHHYWFNRPPVHLLKAAELGLMGREVSHEKAKEEDLQADYRIMDDWDRHRRGTQ